MILTADRNNFAAADFVPAVQAWLGRTGHKSMDVRVALCDMDGTLYDSMPRHARAWHDMMLTQGLDIPAERFFALEGRTGADTINLLMQEYFGRTLDAGQCAALYSIKSENFRRLQQTEGIRVMEGATQLVASFISEGIEPVLVTGSGQSSLIDRLAHDYPGAFGLRVTARDVSHGKPHPEPYLRAMSLAGATTRQAFVLENAPLGVMSGYRAGMFTIAVNTGPIPAPELEAAGADVTFASMIQCRDAFGALLEAMRGTQAAG